MNQTSRRRQPIIKRVDVALIIPLRHAVLRQHLPLEASHFVGDGVASTLHLAALDGTLAIGCASLVKSEFAGQPAYQLRGMAIDPLWRGVGLGSQLLAFAELLLRDDPVRLRWCNARSSARGFYAKLGWTVASAEFDIPTAGPHFQMTRVVAD